MTPSDAQARIEAEIESLMQVAAAGPASWTIHHQQGYATVDLPGWDREVARFVDTQEARYYVALRDAAPVLLAALRDARAENDTLRLVRSDAEAELAELRARIEAVCAHRAGWHLRAIRRSLYGRGYETGYNRALDDLRAALSPAEEQRP